MTRYPVPDEARLEQLIKEAFDLLAGPDMARLALTEAKLYRHRQPEKRTFPVSKLPWWIVLLLSGGLAAAAWWGGELWLKKPGPVPVPERREAVQHAGKDGRQSDPDGGIPAPDLQEESEQREEAERSPVIYQRENF